MAATVGSAYSPVENRNIRLLCLEAGQHDDPIRFSLDSLSLDSEPIYEAISYCWGDRNARQDVSCVGISMSITTSLCGALREFRHSVEHRMLWADGICINQNDENEKTHQVRLMQEIYAKAKMVLVWLGPMDEAGLLSNVCTSIKELHEFIPDFEFTLPPEAHESIVAQMMRRGNGRHDWRALFGLFALPWFTRKWVVQEVVMAQEVSLHIGGGIQLPWVDLSSLVTKIDFLGVLPLITADSRLEDRKALSRGYYNILMMGMVSNSRAAGRGTLVDAVMMTRGLSCSDHHDHIYGVLSCAGEGPTLDPDYTLSVDDTFKTFTKTMLTEGGNLKVLSLEPHKGGQLHPGVPKHRTGLPSWVPDLRRPSSDLLVATSLQKHSAFSAGGPRNPVLSLSDDGRFLRCQGVIVDEIEGFVPSINEMLMKKLPEAFESYSALPSLLDPCVQSHRRRVQRWVQACYDLAYSQESVFDNAGTKDDFSCTLLCDQGRGAGGQQSAEMISTTFEYVEHVLSQDYSMLSSEQGLQNRSPDLEKQWAPIQQGIFDRCPWRRFCVTTVGRLGQMPMGTEKGDLVCVLVGGEVPFVLRPTNHGSTSYNVIGDCFLNGVMNGEMLSTTGYATREIVLA